MGSNFYGAFSSLQLRRMYRTPEFPPKKLRNSSPKLLEHRRQLLENYLRVLVRTNNPIPSTLLDFLNVPIRTRYSIKESDWWGPHCTTDSVLLSPPAAPGLIIAVPKNSWCCWYLLTALLRTEDRGLIMGNSCQSGRLWIGFLFCDGPNDDFPMSRLGQGTNSKLNQRTT